MGTISIFARNPKTTVLVTLAAVSCFLIFSVEFYLRLIDGHIEQNSEGLKRHIRFREHIPLSTINVRADPGIINKGNNLSAKRFRALIDQNGFISPSSIHDNPTIKIFFLGGSTTECLLMKDEERFPYLVGRYLEKNGLTVNSYNGGVSGNNSMHSINILLNKVLPMRPDFVVFLHNINDLTPLMYYGTYWNNNTTRSLVVVDNELTMAHHLYAAAKIFARRLLPNTYQRLREARSDLKQLGGADEWQDVRAKDLNVDEEHIKQEFRRSLLTFIHIAKMHSFVPVLMTQSRRENLSNVTDVDKSIWLLRTRLFDEFNNIIRQIGESDGIHVIDLNSLVPNDEEYMYDSLHYTAKGSDFVAKTIAKYFEDNLLPH